ncbi:MAG: G-D-S-L family lipolytic protein [Pricia sp.]|nr:G-D-S-L family lipolytic protein [Pricia sp.]
MKSALFIILIFFSAVCHSQDTERFKKEVEEIGQKYDTLWDASKETIVFTGSSSIRIWHDLQARFPDYQIINSGFGGSQASDLLHYSYDLILRFKPKKVFIYEGDNDISAKKRPNTIIATTRQIIDRIHRNNPETEIVLISAKPSLSRWKLKGKYKRLNRKFERLAKTDGLLEFADVWQPMLDGRKVKQDIFIADGLHMNAKGYEIWFGVMKNYIN